MSTCPNTLESSSDQELFGEYFEEAPRLGEPGYELAPIREPSLSSLSSSDSVGLPSPLGGLSPVRSPDLWPNFWPLNRITSSTVVPLVPYSPSVTPDSTPGSRSPVEPYYWVDRTSRSVSPPPPTTSRASTSSRRYSPQRRHFSPPRRSRERTRRPVGEVRFPNESSRSPRTHSSGYHRNLSFLSQRRSRSLSPQQWEQSRGYKVRSLRCLTLVRLPRHFRKRELSIDFIEREYSCSCGRGVLNCRLCSTGVLNINTRFTILASKGEPHRQFLEAQDILPDQDWA